MPIVIKTDRTIGKQCAHIDFNILISPIQDHITQLSNGSLICKTKTNTLPVACTYDLDVPVSFAKRVSDLLLRRLWTAGHSLPISAVQRPITNTYLSANPLPQPNTKKPRQNRGVDPNLLQRKTAIRRFRRCRCGRSTSRHRGAFLLRLDG